MRALAKRKMPVFLTPNQEEELSSFDGEKIQEKSESLERKLEGKNKGNKPVSIAEEDKKPPEKKRKIQEEETNQERKKEMKTAQ